MVLSAILFGFSILFIGIELRANRKRKNINKALDFIQEDFNEDLKDSSALAGGAVAFTLYDIYEACDKHEHVLDVIEQRFNRTMGPNSSPLDWYSKVEELNSKGEKARNAYVSAYAGQAGENASVETLESRGHDAELFESRTHPDNDISVEYSNGTAGDISVKSYTDPNDFLNVVENSDSTHYMVNQETFEKLRESGKLAELNSQGIIVENGGFSHELNKELAQEALSDISDAGSITDDIPWVAAIFYGVKTAKNIKHFVKGKQSLKELGINATGDLARIGSMGFFAVEGAEVGMAVGTLMAPGIGTLIGLGCGALVGAVGGSKLVNWIKEELKWGKIIHAIEHFGKRYENSFNKNQLQAIKNNILKYEEVKNNLKTEKKLLKNYNKELNPYSSKKINVPATLSYLYTKNTKLTLSKMNEAVYRTEEEVFELINKSAKKLAPKDKFKQKDIKRKLLGEIILSNSDIFIDETLLDEHEVTKLNGYKNQMKSAPNHPYRLTENSKDLLTAVTYKSLTNISGSADIYFGKNIVLWIMMFTLLCATSFLIINEFLTLWGN